MKQTQYFIPTLKEDPAQAEAISHKLLLKGGYIKQTAAGIYTYLPLGFEVLENVKKIVRDELNAIGAAEMLMPIMQPKELWLESGRWDAYGDEMMRLQDRHKRDFALGPTHEEVVTDSVRDYLNSYKKLPLVVYQIQNKYRDERRPRFGLMRGREFMMKDAYSFHETQASLEEWYQKFYDAYTRIFTRCHLQFRPVKAQTGEIGGDESFEFMALSEIGEDTIVFAEGGNFAANQEVCDLPIGAQSPDGIGTIQHAKGIEVGQVFQLGDKYSQAMKATFMDRDGKEKPYLMGCYGIGVSRVMMAVVEHNVIDDRIVWPRELAPFHVHILTSNQKDEALVSAAETVYQILREKGVKVLLDDRHESMGAKQKDANLIGACTRITFGRDFKDGLVEVFDNITGESTKLSVAEATNIK